jgi:hypothetical protein
LNHYLYSILAHALASTESRENKLPTNTYTPLATVTLGSSASSVTFSSIPATYRDLVIVVAGTTSASSGLYLRLNGDTGANYTAVYAYGTGSSAVSTTSIVINGLYIGNFTNVNQSVSTNHLMDYSATDKHKTMVGIGSDPSNFVIMNATRWANTAAVTSVLVLPATGTMSAGMTLSMYGIVS